MKYAGLLALLFALIACEEEGRKTRPATPQPKPVKPEIELVPTPEFSADSAYAFIEKQVEFGPRVPNSEPHRQCARWLESKLESYGLEVITQEATVKSFNNLDLNIFNIMGRYRPEAQDRILLCAHWDTRPYADRGKTRMSEPIDGANDGASGVAVLLELARVINLDTIGPNIGYDIIFFDAEDYGKPEASMVGTSTDSWCLGSQYWSRNIPVQNYKPRYGILLDMVGAGNAVFPKDGVSMHYAPHVVEKVWAYAHKMGHKSYFHNSIGPQITDDHVPLNQIANIPTIDIIHYELGRMDFGSFHHTHEDDMDIIDPATLKVVGDVVLQTVYQEKSSTP